MFRQQSVKLLGLLQASQQLQHVGASAGNGMLPALGQLRHIGGDKVPEFWGKPSTYTAGTAFLGTPADHQQLIHKRPLSPDVIEIDGKSLHYNLPVPAWSSIANRVTGVSLSVAFAGAGWLALAGNLPGTITAIASTTPVLLVPLKALVAYTLVYHYLGGIRHLVRAWRNIVGSVWDSYSIGNQAEKKSLLELPAVELSSRALFIGSGVLAIILAFL